MKSSDTRKSKFFLAAFSAIFGSFSVEGVADLRNSSGTASLTTVGSPADRVLWNLRPEVALQYARSFSMLKGLNLDLQVRGRADTQSQFELSGRHYDTRIDRAVIELLGSKSSVAVGFQKVSWGEPTSFDGVDVVNARDLNEPLYSDRELVKLSVPALAFQFLGDNSIFQLVWVFMAQRSPIPEWVEGIPVKEPSPLRLGEDMEVAVKAGGLTRSGWDINGYWAWHLERLPQLILTQSSVGAALELYEPRVLTVGLTTTQAVGETVIRFELAQHSDRAVPDFGMLKSESASQVVSQIGLDWNVGETTTLTGEFLFERWGRESSSGFVGSSELAGLGMRKIFNNGKFETQVNTLFDFRLIESFASGRLVWKFQDQWQFDLAANVARTSKGRPLARRLLKDLIRSELSVRF